MLVASMFCAATSVSMAAASAGRCGLQRGDETEDGGERRRGALRAGQHVPDRREAERQVSFASAALS